MFARGKLDLLWVEYPVVPVDLTKIEKSLNKKKECLDVAQPTTPFDKLPFELLNIFNSN
jgi:hypothetical protein